MRQIACLFGLTVLLFCKNSEAQKLDSLVIRAKKIHENIITIDTHNDFNVSNFTSNKNYTQRLDTQVNLPKMIEGGLDVTWLIVYTGQDSMNLEGYKAAEKNAMDKFKAIHRLCEEYAPDKIELATSSKDVRRIHASGKKVAMIGVENAYPMSTNLQNIKKYREMGALYVSLAHNGHNQFSDSHTGEEDNKWLNNGLSELGKEAVKQLNRNGIMIDVSHPSKEAFNQMVNLSKAPIIASHSSARALCDHSRNLDDEQLMKLKKNGGVVQTVAFSAYLNTQKDTVRSNYMKDIYRQIADSLQMPWYDRTQFGQLSADERKEFFKNYRTIKKIGENKANKLEDAPPAVNVSDFIDHIDYMVKLIGIDHVGISSDFDGGGGIEGWSDASETFNVTLELVKRGYSEEEIAKLWGENLLRVLDEVQAHAETY
ncbi:dipeptidase [Cytophaga sp. FL35]|uniref:dipeptidase n=1 Tax=Cytophaga sp. FL35 TaxID=1904456 RepID=UPI001653D648|nr:dipeptidase [Cytophaga sp. FL35]MBC7000030.1 membrane dipeptidase [Cytophaga sp. FL35]